MPRGPRGSARFWWQEMGAKGNSRLRQGEAGRTVRDWLGEHLWWAGRHGWLLLPRTWPWDDEGRGLVPPGMWGQR